MDTSDLYIDYLCRTCMTKLESFMSEGSTEPQHQSIFETIEECDELRIADLLSSTIPQIVEVQLSDELPKKICCKCLHQLIRVYRFQKLCVQSDHKMREMISKKLDDLNMSMMEAEIDDNVLRNDTDSCPLSSCQPKCTAQNSLPEIETALEGKQQAIEVESAQCSTAEHLLKHEQLLDCCENSQGELSEFIKKDPIEDDEENTEYSDTTQPQGELSEFIKNEPIEDDEENTEYRDTIHSTTFLTKEEFTTEEQKLTVPYKDIRDKNYQYPCDICGKRFKTTWHLNRHERSHSGEKPHKCDFCEKRFAEASKLRQHTRTHTGEKPYKCKYCARCFTKKDLLNKHLLLHLGDNIHRCESCPLAFHFASELRLHSTTHKDEDPDTRERNMAALREEEAKLKVNRYKDIRDKNYQYPCDICGKHFNSTWHLNRHERSHSGEKPHKCDFCEKRLAEAAQLREHMRTHTGEKPYKCKYCERCFTTKKLLNKHLRVHLGDNIHRCESCPLAFRLASELLLHSTTHKDEDPETHERNMAGLRKVEQNGYHYRVRRMIEKLKKSIRLVVKNVVVETKNATLDLRFPSDLIIFTEVKTFAQMDASDLYIDYLCRTCLIKLESFASEGSIEPQHQSIFETIEECGELRIADLLSSTIPEIVHVQLSDELPKKICCKCLHQLINVYRFQKLCVQSDHKMRELVSKKWADLNMSTMEAAIEDDVLPNGTDSYPLSSCQPKCTAQNSLLPETETAPEGRQQAIESDSAQWSTAEHLLKNDELLYFCDNSQGEVSKFIKNDPIEDEENTEYSDTIQAQGELSEFIKNEPVEDDEENTEYSDTIHSTTFVAKAEFKTEEQKVTVPYKNIRDKNEQYQYPCDICGKHFKTKSVFNRHKRIHSGEKPHKCDFCEKRFVLAVTLREHMRTHTGEKPHKCKYCKRCFATKSALNEHLRVHHMGDNIHRCKFCPLAFRLASELWLHSTTHKGEDPKTRERNMAALREEEAKLKVNRYKNIRDKNYQYPCDICGKHFKTTWDLDRHERSHSGEKPHKCDFCEKRYAQAAHLREHMRSHTGEKPYTCKYCERCIASKKLLNQHLRVHLGDNVHRCKFCPLAFRFASELRLHSTTHTDEDPETRERNMAALREEEAKLKVNRDKNIRDKNEQYQYPCDICGKHFKTTWDIKQHKRIHSDEKPHKCDFCGKRFVRTTSLSHHMRTHTGEKPYTCKYCDRCFTTKDRLNKHLRVHLGDNIHRCECCPLAFRLASELWLHSTTHKDEDPETHERNMAALKEEEAKLKVNKNKNIRDKNGQYSCDNCGKHFKTKSVLNLHKLIHSDEKPHKCDFCEKRFAQAAHLREHMRTHTGEKPYKCKYCDRCFTTKTLSNKHLRVHLGDNIHRCGSCPLAFHLASKLRLHSTSHKDEDPETRERNMAALREEEAKLKVNRYKYIRDQNYQYPCDICGKHFIAKSVLNLHKLIHSGEKPHKCDLCEMRFATAVRLKEHMRTHTGEKPYKCKYCDRCFTTKKLLNKHLRVHLGDNIHRCESCPLAFRLASELRLHSTTHKDEDPKTRERNLAALREEEAKLKVNRRVNIAQDNEVAIDLLPRKYKNKVRKYPLDKTT
ncbi:zinc finger protein 721-like [Eurosta solidaginis]|uniref:zinc finger protein 721-like n=1 Tax=Eurosta solidaginis TaxID=178769 RepID=UPI0035316590